MIGKLQASADELYQALTQADRPITADANHRPWLAALWSIVLCGGGQLYNRQLAKAVRYFLMGYLPLAVTWGIYFILLVLVDPETSSAWLETATSWVKWAAYLMTALACLFWVNGVLDAYRTAVRLRAGQLLVRYGLKRQALHLAAGFVPVVGEYVPDATVTRDERRPALADLMKQDFRQRLLKRIVTRLVGFGCIIVLLFLLLVGVIASAVTMISIDGLKMK